MPVRLDTPVGPVQLLPNKPDPEPLTDISGIVLKECRPFEMRLTPAGCAEPAPAGSAGRTTATAPRSSLQAKEAEKQRLKYCLDCPDAETEVKPRTCSVPGCHHTPRADGLCTRHYYQRKAERRRRQTA